MKKMLLGLGTLSLSVIGSLGTVSCFYDKEIISKKANFEDLKNEINRKVSTVRQKINELDKTTEIGQSLLIKTILQSTLVNTKYLTDFKLQIDKLKNVKYNSVTKIITLTFDQKNIITLDKIIGKTKAAGTIKQFEEYISKNKAQKTILIL
jgi:hypothetical protein